jgi:PTS system mannose-specific IID component
MKRGMLSAATRLFLFQASMNHERLQGLGMASAVEPLLRDLNGGPAGKAYRAAMGRAAGFFNTHPYLAGLAVGAVAKAEHQGLSGQQVDRLRTALKGPLGSLGDRLIWAGTLPAAAAVGLILLTLTHPLIAIGGFLLLFNAVHFTLRWWGLGAGWRAGVKVTEALRHPVLQAGLKTVGPVAALMIGAAIPVVAEWLTEGFDWSERWGMAGVALVTVVVMRWLAPTVGAARLGMLALAAMLILGWVW